MPVDDSTADVRSPLSAVSLQNTVATNDYASGEKFQMKKEIGLLEGVAIIIGIILGSGIFISPGGVLEGAGSLGLALSIWVLCGLLTMVGAVSYAELGTSILKSGGDYAYIHESFGSLPAFLFLWDAVLVFVPTTNAIMGLTFANYVIQPFFPSCALPDTAVRLLAAVVLCFLTFINCYNMKITTQAQNIFMFAKVAAVAVVITTGLAVLYLTRGAYFENIWQGTTKSPGNVAVAVYSGIFCYSGWNYLNFMTEELKDPYKNLPRAIYISIPIVAIIYFLTNVAYLAVLTPQEIFASKAIAVVVKIWTKFPNSSSPLSNPGFTTDMHNAFEWNYRVWKKTYGHHILGTFAWIMSIFVAIGAAGSLSIHIMTSSRMCFVGARSGHFPVMFSHIHLEKLTPTTSLIFLNILSLMMLCTSDIYVLITYASFVESFFIMLSIASLLYLRWKRPNLERPIKVSLIVPVLYVIVALFLVVLPCYVKPFEVGCGVFITLTGIPVYYIFVHKKNSPRWLQHVVDETTLLSQKVFLSTKADAE